MIFVLRDSISFQGSSKGGCHDEGCRVGRHSGRPVPFSAGVLARGNDMCRYRMEVPQIETLTGGERRTAPR
jgi:hypothetical protein